MTTYFKRVDIRQMKISNPCAGWNIKGLFKNVRVGQVFHSNGNQWIKSSSRTARLVENDRVFYFAQNERVSL